MGDPAARRAPDEDAREHSFHPLAWCAWAAAAAVAVQLAPNPLYVVLVVGIAALIVQTHGADGPFARAFPALVTLGVVFALVRVLIAAATTHTGLAGQALFSTPAATLPRLLGGFTIGGAVETGVVLEAAAQGLTIVGIMAVFGAFNAVVSHAELVDAAPRSFHELGLVVTVGLAFVPSTIRAVGATREADRARTGGRPVRRGRLLRQAIPILESGLERAVGLAESMDSRGFARGGATDRDRAGAWCGLGALLALAGVLVALVGRATEAALACAALGAAGLAAAALLGSGGRRPRYRPRRAARADWAMALLACLAPVTLAVLALAGDTTLVWSATVPLRWPRFALLPALALAPLLSPLLPVRPRLRLAPAAAT